MREQLPAAPFRSRYSDLVLPMCEQGTSVSRVPICAERRKGSGLGRKYDDGTDLGDTKIGRVKNCCSGGNGRRFSCRQAGSGMI